MSNNDKAATKEFVIAQIRHEMAEMLSSLDAALKADIITPGEFTDLSAQIAGNAIERTCWFPTEGYTCNQVMRMDGTLASKGNEEVPAHGFAIVAAQTESLNAFLAFVDANPDNIGLGKNHQKQAILASVAADIVAAGGNQRSRPH